MRPNELVILSFVIVASTACDGQSPTITSPGVPRILSTRIVANPHNVLSAIVVGEVRDADSVSVMFGPANATYSTTPATVANGAELSVPVLHLQPATPYVMRLIAWGRHVAVTGEPVAFTTGELPADLPIFSASGSDPAPRFVAVAAGNYGVVLNNDGRVVWYRRFAHGAGLNFQAQPSGTWTARPPGPAGAVARWIEMDALGNVLRHLDCARGLTSRFHDLIVMPDRSFWIMCDESRTLDLRVYGGQPGASVMGTVVQNIDAAGRLLFEWSALDHLPITDLPLAERAGAIVNFTHGNAIDLDTDGNLVVSFRSLNELAKIDTRTGAVLWRMGGTANQFRFFDHDGAPFARQHGVRILRPGTLLVLDNLGDASASRAKRFTFDETEHSARLTNVYESLPAVSAQLGGSVQELPSGRVLVSFGSAGRVEEYDAAGSVTWRLDNPGYVFRAQRVESLYRPGAGMLHR
jgi:hypothetical protein